MKIEPNKYYKTRDGRKAYVVGIMPDVKNDFCFLGYIVNGGNTAWQSGGTYEKAWKQSNYDLIGLWEDEPEKLEKLENDSDRLDIISKINEIIDAFNNHINKGEV